MRISDWSSDVCSSDLAGAAEASYRAAGMNICHIDETRSRITVSNINDVPLKWSATGCVNDRTQFGHSGARWSRSFVPNSEATIDIRNFEPQRSEERREGKECVRTCRSRGWARH